jgi:hypothetical protein
MVYGSWLRNIMGDMRLVLGTWLSFCLRHMVDDVIGIGTLIEELFGAHLTHIIDIWFRYISWYMMYGNG